MNIEETSEWKWIKGMYWRWGNGVAGRYPGRSAMYAGIQPDLDDVATQGCIEFGILAPLGIGVVRNFDVGCFYAYTAADANEAIAGLRTKTRVEIYRAIFELLHRGPS